MIAEAKEAVETVEQEPVEAQETVVEGEESGTPPVEEGVSDPQGQDEGAEQAKGEGVDKSGVPWKNRFKEMERKYYDSLERRMNETDGTPRQPASSENEDEELPPTRSSVRRVIHEETLADRRSEQLIDSVLDGLAVRNPDILNYRDEIVKEVRAVDPTQRVAGLIEAVSYAVYGKKNFARKVEQPKPVKKIVASASKDVLPPASRGGGVKTVTLTSDEQAYNWQHRLTDRGFTNEEVHDMFVRSSKKK